MKTKHRFLCLVLTMTLLLPTFLMPTASAYSTTAMPKGIQVFAGFRNSSSPTIQYEAYSDADILAMSEYTNDYIINNVQAVFTHYSNTSGPVVTEEEINSIPLSKTSYSAYDQYYDTMVSTYLNVLNSSNPSVNLLAQADAEVELAKQIISVDPDAAIWFSFPLISYFPLADKYIEPMKNYANYIKSEMGTQWNSNVRGFYYAYEAVGAYSVSFDEDDTVDFGCPHVELMKALSDHVKGTHGKQFMWMPYLGLDTGTTTSSNFVRNGYVINRTNIFDYVLIQPNYYFDTTNTPEPLRRVLTCAANNKAYDYNGNVIGGSKISNTKIGVVMEITDAVTQYEYSARYYEYTLKYDSIKTSVPVIFYAGAQPSAMNATVQYYIARFMDY